MSTSRTPHTHAHGNHVIPVLEFERGHATCGQQPQTRENKMQLKTALISVTLILVGCGGGGDDGGTVVVSESQTLTEGAQLSYTLPAGTYAAEITSSNNGARVSWVGGSGTGCNTSAEVKTYTSTCALSIQGQLLVLNPTTFGLGGSEIVSIKVTRN